MDLLLNEKTISSKTKLICLAPPEKIAQPGWKNIQVQQVGFSKRNIWEQFELPYHARGRLLFSPANIGPWNYRNQVVTIHDASIFALPEAFSFSFRAKYTFVLKQLANRTRLIITDS